MPLLLTEPEFENSWNLLRLFPCSPWTHCSAVDAEDSCSAGHPGLSCGLEAVARRIERFPRCVFWVGRPSAPNVSFKSLIVAAYSECWVRMCYEAILYNVGGTVLKGKGKKDRPLFAFDRTNVSCVEGEAGGTNLELCPPQ